MPEPQTPEELEECIAGLREEIIVLALRVAGLVSSLEGKTTQYTEQCTETELWKQKSADCAAKYKRALAAIGCGAIMLLWGVFYSYAPNQNQQASVQQEETVTTVTGQPAEWMQ